MAIRSMRMEGYPVGVCNTRPETKLPTDEFGHRLAVREADNVVFDSIGKPRVRPGFTRVHTGVDAHSGWSDPYFPFALMVDGGTLYAVFEDFIREPLVGGMEPGLRVSYCRANDTILWTNGVKRGLVTADAEARPWCAPMPTAQPDVAAAPGGGLSAGEYQVTLTVVDAWGREGGARLATPVTVEENGAVVVSNIPAPPQDGRHRVYMTGGGDGVFRAVASVPEGVTTLTISQPPEGTRLSTWGLVPMPAGHIVTYGSGRQFVASGATLLYSPAMRYGLFDPKAARVRFDGRINMMCFVGDGTDAAGLYVADNKRTYFLRGADPMNWSQVIAYPHGAMPGQLAFTPGNVWGMDTSVPMPVWVANNGQLCVGTPGGQVFLPQPVNGVPTAAFDVGDRAALMYSEQGGDRRVVAAVQSGRSANLAVKDQLIVHEYRHEK